MADVFKTVDLWFLIMSVLALSGWFVWSIRTIFTDFKASVERLGDLIEKLYAKHDDHESRLSALEGRCDAMHGQSSGGRRGFDTSHRL